MDAEKEPTGVTRGQNALIVQPMEWASADDTFTSWVDRIDTGKAETQLLVITADAENAANAARALVHAAGDKPVRVLAVSSGARATRLLRNAPAHVVIGSPADLVALLRASALKLESVQTIVFAWLDSILETPDAAPLETLLSDAPKDGARLVYASEMSPAYEPLLERYARRARRPATEQPAEVEPTAINAQYIAITPATRASTLRRLLDALDLPRAELFARTASAVSEATATLRSLGYADSDHRVVSGPSASTNDPMVLTEIPTSYAELSALLGVGARTVYALVGGSQLATFRNMLSGGALTPIALLDAADRARGRDSSLRASLREILASGDVRREVLALEPLLAEYDGIEIAAAALKMLEQQRPQRPASAPKQELGPTQKLFINLGEKDGVRRPEIVALISAQAGIPASQIGAVEVRDSHSLVDVPAAIAELVVSKVSGAMVRGRNVAARLDTPRDVRAPRGDRPQREERPRGDRPARSFDKGDRPARPFDKGDRPARPFNREDRPARPFNREDRPSRPSNDRGPARPFNRDDRPARPAGRSFDKSPRPFDKGDRGPDAGARSTGPRAFDRGDALRHSRPRNKDSE